MCLETASKKSKGQKLSKEAVKEAIAHGAKRDDNRRRLTHCLSGKLTITDVT